MFKKHVISIPMPPSITDKTAHYVRESLYGEGSGHDWWHIYRVWKNSETLARLMIDSPTEPNPDMEMVSLAALLHDIADHKFHDGDLTKGPEMAAKWLRSCGYDEAKTAIICEIISLISYKGAKVPDSMPYLEGKIVQDADRLDAMGAIGIARVFAYGGHKGQALHDPNMEATLHENFESYFRSPTTSINHFYEKLLLLKDRMHTPAAKKIADERHAFMESYLEQFYLEWEGKA